MKLNSEKLTKIDLQILHQLDIDCRTSLSEIGKKIRKSPQYVKYRLEKLIEEKTIQAVSILNDLPLESFETYAFITLKGSDITEEKLLLDALFKMPETYRLYYCDGFLDILVSFIVHTPERIQEITETLNSQFSNISSIIFNAVISSSIYTKKYLVTSTVSDEIKILRRSGEKDKLTKAILAELNKNPFAPLLDLSNSLNLSYDKIKYFFKKSKPYKGTRLVLSDSLIKKAVLLLNVKKSSDDLVKYAALHQNVIQLDRILGEYNFAVYFESMPNEELHRIIKEFLYHFKDSIDVHTRLDILNTYKYRYVET